MFVFVGGAAVLLLIGLAALVLPLSRRSGERAVVGRNEANLQILRDQLGELEADLRNGVLSAEQFDAARSELERRALEESTSGQTEAGLAPARAEWLAPLLITMLLPIFAITLYAQLGSTEGLDVDTYLQQQADQVSPEQIAEMTRRLASHLEENPDDLEGWIMLGRSYRAMRHFDAAARAWGRASLLRPDDPNLLTEYAEALGLAAQGDLTGEPSRLLERALQLDPNHRKALALSGSAAFSGNDFTTAIAHWQKLLALSEGDQQLTDALVTAIAEAQARIGQPAGVDATQPASVAGEVRLSEQVAQAAAPDDVVFIFARAATGPGMPLAVERVTVSDLPYRFRLDDSMAMTAQRKISDAGALVVGARVSKSGGASRASGDLEGFSGTVPIGAGDVRVVIDQRVP
jgi:cytochrome c-type biogenesis protein CcmH